jgi:hypothetical protein
MMRISENESLEQSNMSSKANEHNCTPTEETSRNLLERFVEQITSEKSSEGGIMDLDASALVSDLDAALSDQTLLPANYKDMPDVDEILSELMDGLSTLPMEDTQSYALDHIAQAALLPRGHLEKFMLALEVRGVPKEWLRASLRPAITEARRKKPRQPGGGHTSTDYVNAANELGYQFRLNVLEDNLEVNGQRMVDVLEAEILSGLHDLGMKQVDVARRAFLTAAKRNQYHPVKEYLESLKWDKEDHIATLATYIHDNHDEIHYADGTKRTVLHAWLYRWLIGAVGKVYDPTKVQNPMLILDGKQGGGKSTFAKWLCPLQDLFFEGAIRPDDTEYLRYLTSKWVWEVSELGATLRRADREALKAFITMRDATYRPAYGRYPLKKPALASFIGTVNFEGALLSDPTGHRRFLPVEVVSIHWAYATDIDVHQLWAQAYALYKSGERWGLSPEEQEVRSRITERYEVEDLLASYIPKLFTVKPEDEHLFASTTDIVDHLIDHGILAKRDRAAEMQLSATLTKMGLRSDRIMVQGKRVRGWRGITLPPAQPAPPF